MWAELKELWRFRELLISLTERELRIRYKNSALGFLWSLVNPLVTALVMSIVFKYFLSQGVGSYTLYVLAAYIPYAFFQFALMDSAQSILVSLPMVRKVYFPREVLPLAQIFANFIHLVLALGVFVVISILVWLRTPGEFPIRPTVVILPLVLLVNLALATGLSLIISALNTFYEDVKYIMGAVLYIMFFLTPVMYFSENVRHATSQMGPRGDLLYILYHLNPMATLCTTYKKVLLAPTPVRMGGETLQPLDLDWGLFGIAALMSLGILVLGYHVFNRMKWRFVERP